MLGVLPKRLLFTMVKNTDFLGTAGSNPFKFRHYDLEHYAMYVGGKQIPSEDLSLDMSHEKTSVMGYRTLFEGSGINHSKSGPQITPAMHINNVGLRSDNGPCGLGGTRFGLDTRTHPLGSEI